MTGSVEPGTSQTHGDTHILHFLVRLPRPMEAVWPRLSTPDGLAAWFTEADVLQPRLGGVVALRGLGAGEVTAWDVDRIVEFTFADAGRLRFHLERDERGSVLRFTHEFRGETESERRWRERFERLVATFDAGTPDTSTPGTSAPDTSAPDTGARAPDTPPNGWLT
jgi:uncharacterized protein YndB with AHSA1/START domain